MRLSKKMSRLLQAIEKYDKIAIAGHVNSDGDCVGSTLGLWNYITSNYPEKKVVVFLDSLQNKFSYMNGFKLVRDRLKEGENFDLFIALDCGDGDRLGQFKPLLESPYTFCIDHHITNVGYCDENEVRGNASSTCEIIFELIDEKKVDKSAAECLYTGIAHDTGVFKYSCTSPRTMEIAGKLMSYGIDFGKIIDESFYERTYNELRMIGYSFLNSHRELDGKFIYSIVSWKEMKEFGVGTAELDSISSQLRNVEGVECAALIYQKGENIWKASLRANGNVDMSIIATAIGGGGHKNAAGCTYTGSCEDFVALIESMIKAQLDG